MLGTSRATVRLLSATGAPIDYALPEPCVWQRPSGPLRSRVAFAAAHVIPRRTAENVPGAPADIDWDATLAVRHDIWSYGLGVADAMDTAQRGMGLDWPAAAELIVRTAAEARSVGGLLACGAGTDQLDPNSVAPGRNGLAAVLAAYREQIELVVGSGARVILMASRALARIARSADDYAHVYSTLLDELDAPVVLHWLGAAFDPQLSGYWGSADVAQASGALLRIIAERPEKVDGVKVSLLDAVHEVRLRAALPAGVRMYTGDDFNYPDLVVGDESGYSDALLGVFAAIYPAASVAVQLLDSGEVSRAWQILDDTRALGRYMFAPPTYYYKVGVAFLSWLNGRQPALTMVGGLQSARSIVHYCELFRLAGDAGLLADPGRAAQRMRSLLAVYGWEA